MVGSANGEGAGDGTLCCRPQVSPLSRSLDTSDSSRLDRISSSRAWIAIKAEDIDEDQLPRRLSMPDISGTRWIGDVLGRRDYMSAKMPSAWDAEARLQQGREKASTPLPGAAAQNSEPP